MRCTRSTSTASASRKMLDSACPAICANEWVVGRGVGGSVVLGFVHAACADHQNALSPRWMAGAMGADWRMEPSPKYSMWSSTSMPLAGR